MIARVYEKGVTVYKKLRKIFSSPVFFTVLISVFTFNVFNAYAQEVTATTINTKSVYDNTAQFTNLLHGVEVGGRDRATYTADGVTTGASFALGLFCPECFDTADEIKASNLPEIYKIGLMGAADQAINYALVDNPPQINVIAHLQEEWVPGYEESSTSVYAENSFSGHPSGYDELMNVGVNNLWAKTRNLAYALYIVVMIVAGFMIMFRNKIGGQMLVTLGNTLPGILIGLVLVTFSFAIAGFVIDLGGLMGGVFYSILNGGQDFASIGNVGDIIKSGFGDGGFWKTVLFGGAGGVGITSVGLMGTAAIAGSAAISSVLLVGALTLPFIIMALIYIGILFVGAIKVIITLLKSYLGILMDVILGPIQIVAGSIPGMKAMTGNWFKSLLKNVLVFPVVFALLNIPEALLSMGSIPLHFPGKLVYEDPTTYGAEGSAGLYIALILILNVVILYIAAQVPKFLEAIFPSSTPKAFAEGFGQAKASLAKVPLLGGLFK